MNPLSEESKAAPVGTGALPGGPPRTGRLWIFAMAAAVAAGLASFAAFEATPTPFEPPVKMVMLMMGPVNQPEPAEILKADMKNAAIAFGIAGATLALALGLAGGLGRGSARAVLTGAVAGLVLGTGVGAGAGAVAVPVFQRQYSRDETAMTKDLTLPMTIHAGIWAAIGAAAGAALGIGAGARGRLPAVVLGGLVGGAMAGALYEVLAALVAPEGQTYLPIAAAWPPRLIAALAGPILVAALAVSGLASTSRRAKPAAAKAGGAS